MGEFSVDGIQLKKELAFAKRQPIAFAFNPGRSDEEHYLGIHRKRAPAVLGKDAKKEGAGKKSAFGFAEVDGKMLNLTCEQVVPGMAKKLKKYLKFLKITMNVQIMDEGGNVLESDVEEDLPDDPDIKDQAVDGAPDKGQVPNAGAKPTEKVDQRALAAELVTLRERIQALPPELAGQVTKPFQQVVGFLKAGEVDRAAEGVRKIDIAIGRLAGKSAKSKATEPKGNGPVLSLVELQKMRLAYDAARKKVAKELRTLESAIVQTFAKEPDAQAMAKAAKHIYRVLETVDERLLDQLDLALNAEDPSVRREMEQDASRLIDDYIGLVETDPIINILDDNPFIPVSVQETLSTTLEKLGALLK